MNKKMFKNQIFILSVLGMTIATSVITFSATNKTSSSKEGKLSESKLISDNKQTTNKQTTVSFYSDDEIRQELKKAGVNDKSIDAFITANNNSKNKNTPIKQIKEEFLNAVKLDDKNYPALNALGVIEREHNISDDIALSYQQAISYHEKSLKINPKFEKAYEDLISIYQTLLTEEDDPRKMDDFLKKQKFYSDQLIKLNPENPEGYSGLYSYYEDKNDYDKAISTGKKTIELFFKTKTPKYYYYEIKDYSPNSDFYGYTNEHSGNMAEFQLLNTYLDKGDNKSAFDYFFKIYDKKRKNPEEYSGLKEDFKQRIKELNEKYKNTDKKLYEENLKKLK